MTTQRHDWIFISSLNSSFLYGGHSIIFAPPFERQRADSFAFFRLRIDLELGLKTKTTVMHDDDEC